MRKTATILFHSRQQAHFWHLQTKSYSEHIALDKYYNQILELTDQLLEVYLGKGKKIDFNRITMVFKSYDRQTMIEYFKKLSRYMVRAKRTLNESDGDLNNIMEEIIALINKTLYLFTLK